MAEMTESQREIIRKGVAQGLIPSIPRDKYKSLTAETAQKYIDQIQGRQKKEPEKPVKRNILKDGESPATESQKKVIEKALDAGEIEITMDEISTLTKQKAHDILTAWEAKRPREPATEQQKDLISTLVHEGFLAPMSRERFLEMDKFDASKLISVGKYYKEQGKHIEGYDPAKTPPSREKLDKSAPMTEKQVERLTQLVKDGHLNAISREKWKKMTIEEAGKFIFIGKQREEKGEKAPPLQQLGIER